MLTGDLVRARVRSGVLRPTFIDPRKPAFVRAAEAMVGAMVEAAAARTTRGEVADALRDAAGDSSSAKVLRGFAKLLLDRCTFETDSPEPPVALRARVFAAARTHGALALAPDPMGRPTADTVLAEVAHALGTTAEAVLDALYADLPDAQRLTAWRPIDAAALPHRYNLALVQAALLHAEEVVLRAHAPSPARLRQLLQHARFCRLMLSARRDPSGLVTVVVDGPGSVLKKSTAYGLDLARFAAAVPRLDVPWTLTAPVSWGRDRRRVCLEVSRDDGLVSHLRDTGGHVGPEVAQLLARWPADAPLQPSGEVLPIDLGGRGVLMPDLAFSDGARTAYLEVAGWWRRDWLDRHLDGLRRHGPGNVVLAVSRRMCADRDLGDLPVEVVDFGAVLPVGRLREAVERVAR